MFDVMVVGGGFAGVWAALAAVSEADKRGADLEVGLLSREPYLTNRPRLYEAFSQDLRFPLAETLEAIGARFISGEATSIDPVSGCVEWVDLDGHEHASFALRLVLATGSRLHAPAISGLAEFGFDVDTFESASRLEEHLRETTLDSAGEGARCVVILGAGSAGIELATELPARLEKLAAASDVAPSRIVLVEQADVVGPELGDEPRPVIERALEEAGVEVLTGRSVLQVERGRVRLSDGSEIPCATTISTVGLRASPIAGAMAQKVGVAVDDLGRLFTDDYLRVVGTERLFAAGDVAAARVDGEHLALMSCQHAMPMGRYAGCNAVRELLGLPLHCFRHSPYVTCIDLGVSGGLLTRGWERSVALQGADAKLLKKQIVNEKIAPPDGSRAEILAEASVECATECGP